MNRARLRAAAAAATGALLLAPAFASASGKFDPSTEFSLSRYVNLKIGPIDLSINKAVIYLLITTFILCVIVPLIVRAGLRSRPGKGQNILELAYEFAENQIGRVSLPAKALPTWFPYVATLFLFIAINNLISFVPLPISGEHGGLGISSMPDFGLYAATANLNVTLALTIVTFLCTHIVGVRAHGTWGYLKTMEPDAPRALKPFIFGIESSRRSCASSVCLYVCSPTCWPATC